MLKVYKVTYGGETITSTDLGNAVEQLTGVRDIKDVSPETHKTEDSLTIEIEICYMTEQEFIDLPDYQ